MNKNDSLELKTKVKVYIEKTFKTDNFLIYGSFAEYYHGFYIKPKDVDIIVVNENVEEPYDLTVNVEGIELPLQITVMAMEHIVNDIERIEPKYFYMLHNYSGFRTYSCINTVLDLKSKGELRSGISSISSKAYHKGKKKLTIRDDYDEYLGLKNIYHSFKFIIHAFNRFDENSRNSIVLAKNTFELYQIYNLIFDTYHQSTGTLEERWKALDSVIKPLYNSYMTEFRKRFPKDKNG